MASERHRVVVIGGGFGGLSCARALDGTDLDVLLLDRHNYHLFTPLLYQVATALLNPSDIAFPLRRVFRKSRNVRFRQERVTGVDLERKLIHTHSGSEIEYDALVVATGGENNYFGNAPLAEHSIGMKALTEALRLRNHVLSCLERAEQAAEDHEKAHWLTFVVVGGGPTGVEYAGALSELLDIVMGRDYPSLKRDNARIVLVEGLDRLLAAFHPKLGEYAMHTLRRLKVDVRTKTLVEKADDDSVTLSTGETLATKTVVWSAGVRPIDPVADDVPRARNRRVEVDDHLRLQGRDDVYVIGDAASFKTKNGELPMLSPPAMQEGRYVARALKERAAGREQVKPFRYIDKGTMATIGRNAAVADVRGFKLKGFLGWLAWLFVHIYYLIGFRNKVAVLMSWAWGYIVRDRPIRLIVRGADDPLQDEIDPG